MAMRERKEKVDLSRRVRSAASRGGAEGRADVIETSRQKVQDAMLEVRDAEDGSQAFQDAQHRLNRARLALVEKRLAIVRNMRGRGNEALTFELESHRERVIRDMRDPAKNKAELEERMIQGMERPEPGTFGPEDVPGTPAKKRMLLAGRSVRLPKKRQNG